jgi:dTDP-4-amino-4,6-dideoxygalactose transaminase
MGSEQHECSTAASKRSTALMFLVHPTLTDAEIDKTCTVIRQVLSEAST